MITKTTASLPESTLPFEFRGHIPALDGLRGVAVLMVLVVHFYLTEGEMLQAYPFLGPLLSKMAFAGTWGVELFFVLSGFLITGILVDAKRNSNYFSVFYMRRVLRIFPLYYTVLTVIFVVLPIFAPFDQAAVDIAHRQIWLWTYLQNAPWSGGHWNDSDLFRLLHFWSLCVEEHFYLLWPLIVRFTGLRHLTLIGIGGICLSLLARVWHTMPDSPVILGWTSLTKLDGLLIGSLIAIGCRNISVNKLLDGILAWVMVFSGIGFAVIVGIPRKAALGYWSAFPELVTVIFFGCVVLYAMKQGSALSHILRCRILASFGKFSYGIYVIHYVCAPGFIQLFQLRSLLGWLGSPLLSQGVFYLLTIGSSYGLAVISWHSMEKHFLSLKSHYEYRCS